MQGQFLELARRICYSCRRRNYYGRRAARDARYSGNVQGVGFRFAVTHIARDHPGASGYVRNLSPERARGNRGGGPRATVCALLEAVRAEMSGCIGDIETQTSPATGELAGFGVRR